MQDAAKPFLVLFKGGPATETHEQPQDRRLALTKYILHDNLWLYLVAETVINNIADAIDAAMQSAPFPPAQGKPVPAGAFAERQTLGGLANNAWIDGGSEWGREFEDNNITVFWRIAVEVGI